MAGALRSIDTKCREYKDKKQTTTHSAVLAQTHNSIGLYSMTLISLANAASGLTFG